MKIGQCIRTLIRLFTPDFDNEPSRPYWIANDWNAALLDLDSGRVLAHVWDDGCGKYYPTLYLSPLEALRLSKAHPGVISWLEAFPRMQFDLLRLKANSLRDAQNAIEALF